MRSFVTVMFVLTPAFCTEPVTTPDPSQFDINPNPYAADTYDFLHPSIGSTASPSRSFTTPSLVGENGLPSRTFTTSEPHVRSIQLMGSRGEMFNFPLAILLNLNVRSGTLTLIDTEGEEHEITALRLLSQLSALQNRHSV